MKHHTTLLALASLLLPLLSASAQSDVMPSLPATVEGFITDPPAESLDARRYQDCPVSHASGSVDVNVPLMSFASGELSVALGLSYHTGGSQVDYGSGRMGLGWSLTGLPQISRQIIGSADESGSVSVVEGSGRNMTASYAQNIINGKTDSFYDIYSYDIPGYAGSFYLKTRNDSVCDVIKLPSNGVIITPESVSGRWPGAVRAFRITTPEGVRYDFASRDTVAVVTANPSDKKPEDYEGYISAWNVTRILARGGDTITINYSPAVPYSISHGSNIFMSEGLVFEDGKPTGRLPYGELPAGTPLWSYVRTHVPRRITSRTATVDFHTRDFGADWAPLRSQITYIDGITLSDKSGRAVRKATLCYSDTVDRNTVEDNFYARLSEVSVHAGDTLVSRHRFSYHGAAPKPFAAADSAASRGNVPPGYLWNKNYLRGESGPWHLLNRIEDASGCVTSFFYESKSCVDASGRKLYKGQRIKSIIAKDTITGRERKRVFTYSNPVLSVDIAGLPESAWTALTGVRRILRSTTREQNVLIAMGLHSPRAPGVDLKTPVIYYSEVVEDVSGTGIEKSLRTSWSYDLTPVIHTVRTGLGTMPPGDGNNSMGRYMGRFTLTGSELPDDFDAETFRPRPLDFYVEKNYGGSPLLTKRVEYEWNGTQYVPLETETRKWSIHRRDGDTRVTGVHCEPLVYQTNSSGEAVSPYKNDCRVVVKNPDTDVSAFDVRSTAYHWLCDTIVTRRHYPGGHHRDLTTIIGYDDPGSLVKSDTCSRSVFVSSLPMTVTRICDGQRIETSRLYSGNITTAAYKKINSTGYRVLPVIERVVSGHDTLDTRYEYGIFNGMPRLTRQYTSRGNYRSPLEQVSFKAYDNYGRPTSGISKDRVSVSWKWEAQSDYLKEQRSGQWQITSFTSLPLTGYTSITSSSGKVRHYELKGGRIVTERNAAGDILSRRSYGLYATDGENFQEQETRSGSYSFVRERVESDGFGMPWLTVRHGGTGSINSIYTTVAYDALDRVTARSVPRLIYNTLIQSGSLDYDEVRNNTDGISDYRYVYPGHSGDTPAESYAPGNDYRHPTIVTRLCNSSSTPMLRCSKYDVIGNALQHSGDRATGSLDVSRVTDPEGRVTLKFTDWRGLTVLERRMPYGEAGGGFLDTYYIHDNLGNLQAVLMPEAIPKSNEIYSLKFFDQDPALKEHAWLYLYNAEGRLSEKRVPGAGTVRYRYDRDGRLAFTQDAEERLEGSCRFYLYDNAGREVVTGLYTASLMPSDSKTAPAAIASLIVNSGQSIENTGYWSNAIRADDAEVLMARYYDNRAFVSYAGFRDIPGVADVKGRPGMLMAVTERVLGPAMQPAGGEALPKFVHTVYEYDDEERCVKAHSSTVRSGEYLTVATVYDVAGNALAVSNTLSHPDGTVDRETTTCQYDDLGRPMRRISSLGKKSGSLVRIHYNELGLPYCTEGAGGKVNYTYDQLSRPATIVNTEFEEHLTYSPAGLISSRRTFIPGHESDTRMYSYDDASRLTSVQQIVNIGPNSQSTVPEAAYIYDRNSNTTSIVRHRRVSDIPAGAPTYHYDEVDNLTLTYDGNRLVKVTDTAGHPVNSGGYDFSDGADADSEYTYDHNGRLTSDLNRGIAAIEWNATSQPLSIRLDGGERLEYTYTASGERLGERLCRIVNASGHSLLSPSALAETDASGGSLRTPPMPNVRIISSRRFVGPFELEGDSVTRVNVVGGYWNADGLHGYVADWQGNIRMVRRASSGRMVQTNSYYPYGLPIESKNPTVNPYKFSAKEFETRHGLNFSHHGARLMLNDLTRFATPDPLAELTPGVSPYVYCAANPINATDPTGLVFDNPQYGTVIKNNLFLLHSDCYVNATIAFSRSNFREVFELHLRACLISDGLIAVERAIEDENIYVLEEKTGPRHVYLDEKNNKTVIETFNFGDTMHELTHVSQVLEKKTKLIYVKAKDGRKCLINAGENNTECIQNEDQAYRVQYAVQPQSYIGKATSIIFVSLDDVIKTLDEMGVPYKYEDIRSPDEKR